MLIYVNIPEKSTKKFPELKDKFGKSTYYKVNIQKLVIFLHLRNT